MTTRQDILNCRLESELVQTAAWGQVLIRHLPANSFERIVRIFDEYDGSSRLAALTILALVDDRGEALLKEEDLDRLLEGPLEPIAQVAGAFLELNGIDDSEKKSWSPSSSSPTPSPLRSANIGLSE